MNKPEKKVVKKVTLKCGRSAQSLNGSVRDSSCEVTQNSTKQGCDYC